MYCEKPKIKCSVCKFGMVGVFCRKSYLVFVVHAVFLSNLIKIVQIKWICPTAPTRPVAVFGGFPSTACNNLLFSFSIQAIRSKELLISCHFELSRVWCAWSVGGCTWWCGGNGGVSCTCRQSLIYRAYRQYGFSL